MVPAGASSEMLDTIPVRNMRGLGGKLGESVISWSKADTASDLKVLFLSLRRHLSAASRTRCPLNRDQCLRDASDLWDQLPYPGFM